MSADIISPPRFNRKYTPNVGEYRHPFENTRMGGETYQSEHVVLFQRVNDLAAYLSDINVNWTGLNLNRMKIGYYMTQTSRTSVLSAAVDDRFMFSDPEGNHCSANDDNQ